MLLIRLLFLKFPSYSHDQSTSCAVSINGVRLHFFCISSLFRNEVFIDMSTLTIDCNPFLPTGSWDCPRYSWKRHGQPDRLAAQCGHDAAAHGPAWPRQED